MAFGEVYAALSGIGDNLYKGMDDAWKRKQDEEGASAMARLFGAAPASPGVAGPGLSAAPAATPSTPLPTFAQGGTYLDTLIGKESSGNASAKNPNSSATGLGQFTTGTWGSLAAKRPELGLTPDGRTDPEQAKRATLALAEENAKVLQANGGHAPTDGNLYLAHFLGGGGAARFLTGLNQNPDAPAIAYVGADQAAANKTIFYNRDGTPKTAREVYAERTSKFGGGQPQQVDVRTALSGQNPADLPAPNAAEAQFVVPGQQAAATGMAPPQPQAGPAAQPQPINAADLRALYASEKTRPLAMELFKAKLSGKDIQHVDLGDAVGWFQNGREIARTPKVKDDATGEIKEYRLYRQQTQEAGQAPQDFTTWSRENKRAGATSITVGDKERQVTEVRKQIAEELGFKPGTQDYNRVVLEGKAPAPAADKAPTEGQSNANLYVRRMEEAEAVLSRPEISAASVGMKDRLAAKIPGVGNYAVSPEYQQAEQAQRDFINATLRRESGAAISPSEFENAQKQYFPQPGDKPPNLAQKARNRQTAIEGIRAAAGPAYTRPIPAQAPGQSQAAAPQQAPAQNSAPEGATATNPQTGQKLMRRGGQWVPVGAGPGA